MKQLKNYINIRKVKSTIKATDKTIHKIVKDELDRLGHDADLNHIDVSEVVKMNYVFSCSAVNLGSRYNDLNPDISKWDVSNVISMWCIFEDCINFNCDISGWDMSKVKNIANMFNGCKNFNQDISKWNVSNVIDMHYMFYYSIKFNQDISEWDVSNVETMENMFYWCVDFNQDLSGWDVRKVERHYDMFYKCPIKEEFKPKFNI